MASDFVESTTLRTRSGVVLRVRAAGPADASLLEEMFVAVSPEDRRFRFLSAPDHINRVQIDPMTYVDHWRTENFLAFDNDTLVATAMLACDASMANAEVAISIRDDYKGQGIGWCLLEHVTMEAKRRGVKTLQSIESRSNHQAIELEREMGFTARTLDDDPTLVVLEAKLQP